MDPLRRRPQLRKPRKRAPSRLPSLGRPWARLAAQVASEEPLCKLAIPGTCTHRSTTADHRIPRSRRPELTYVRSNLRGACRPCNEKLNDGGDRKLAELRRLGAAKVNARRGPSALDFFS